MHISRLFLTATAMAGLCMAVELPIPPELEEAREGPIDEILFSYCYDCHGDGIRKGGLELDIYDDIAHMRQHRDVWKSVRQQIEQKIMPPIDKDQPTDAERAEMIAWIDAAIFPIDRDNPDPGKITLRRLNQSEYHNTVFDLLGVRVDAANELPPDDSGYGFDNISDVLSLAPSHLKKFHSLAVKSLEQLVPHEGESEAEPWQWEKLFVERLPGEAEMDYARRCIEHFGSRAFRRALTDDESVRLLELFETARPSLATTEHALATTYEAVLISPHFLFREIPLLDTLDGSDERTLVPELVLASRLSYFIWGSMPDPQLLDLAERGQLRKNLDSEITRMLAHNDTAERFRANFLSQWLQTRDFKITEPNKRRYRGFNRVQWLADRETEYFLEHLVRHDRPLTDLLNADYSFMNRRLAKFYGLPHEHLGKKFERYSFTPEMRRRGILTHMSVLTITSNPTRTSPVKRGQWVLENLLDTPPPPAPPNVPSLDANKHAHRDLSVRERLEMHRENPSCASCHKLMDGIGFAMENYDGVGRWREMDGKHKVDARGELGTGETFDGTMEMLGVIEDSQRQLFIDCISSKMLTFALGRGLDYYDEPAIEQISHDAEQGGLTVSAYVRAIVDSVPFQYYKK